MDLFTGTSIAIPLLLPLASRLTANNVTKKIESESDGGTYGFALTLSGICYGLYGFNLNDLDGSLPYFFEGMSVAFWSSLAGQISDICHQKWNLYFDKEVQKYRLGDNAIIEASLNQMGEKINEGQEKIVEAIGINTDSVNKNTQQSYNLCLRLETFFDDFSKNSSKEIVEALQRVMETFNEQINDRLTDSINNLTAITQNVLTYQKSESVQREKTIERLTEFNNLIGQTKTDMEKLSQFCQVASKNMYYASENSKMINEKSEDLANSFATLSVLSRDAKDASQNMKTFFDDWDKGMTETTQGHIQDLARYTKALLNIFETHSKNAA